MEMRAHSIAPQELSAIFWVAFSAASSRQDVKVTHYSASNSNSTAVAIHFDASRFWKANTPFVASILERGFCFHEKTAPCVNRRI